MLISTIPIPGSCGFTAQIGPEDGAGLPALDQRLKLLRKIMSFVNDAGYTFCVLSSSCESRPKHSILSSLLALPRRCQTRLSSCGRSAFARTSWLSQGSKLGAGHRYSFQECQITRKDGNTCNPSTSDDILECLAIAIVNFICAHSQHDESSAGITIGADQLCTSRMYRTPCLTTSCWFGLRLNCCLDGRKAI